MISFATPHTAPQVRNIWKTVFGDPDDYMDIYFRTKYRDENTLLYFDNGKAVSSLQMLPFYFSFYNREIPIAYFSGLATLPEARKKGYMAALIEKSLDEMYNKDVPLAVLIPQEADLLNFYRPFGFEQTFDAGTALPNLKEIVEKSSDMPSAYSMFDAFFRQRDMTVQKSFDDFRAIVEEGKLYDFPAKKSLMGMSRLVDAKKLLSVFAEEFPEKSFSIEIEDSLLENNQGIFTVENGKVNKQDKEREVHFKATIGRLAQLLLGYKTTELPEYQRSIFTEKQPLIGFMME